MIYNKQIHWNIGGAFSKYDSIMDFFKKNELFNKYKKITVYDGVENCIWNGGRLHKYTPVIDSYIEQYYSLGWGINLTFTNSTIDINDPLGNHLLNKFHKKGNGIILVNETLKNYIRKNFPKYNLIYSITGCGLLNGYPMKNKDLYFYKNKQKEYDMIVPRCESTFDDKLRELNKDKIEILVSDTCILNCPFFHDHFHQINQNNLKHKDASSKELNAIGECWIDKKEFKRITSFEKKAMGSKYPFYLKPSQIKSLVQEGFSTFKIQGREASTDDFIYDLNRFLIDYDRL